MVGGNIQMNNTICEALFEKDCGKELPNLRRDPNTFDWSRSGAEF